MIHVEGVSKTYRSPLRRITVQALDDLSVSVAAGEVMGVAGPNGAGKTTLLAILLGYLPPSAGRVTLDGLPPRHFVQTRGVAYLSELINVPPWWTVAGALRRYAVLTGVPAASLEERVGTAIDQLGIGEHRRKQVRHLSKGNLQRLGIAQVLLSDSPIVILDEPTHGLDPIWTGRFRDIIHDLRRADRAIVIASHNLDELERVADRVAILDQGRLSRIADKHAHHEAVADYRLVLDAEFEELADVFPDAERGASPHEIGYLVHGELDALNAGLRALLERGARIRAFYPARSRLETAFREAVGES